MFSYEYWEMFKSAYFEKFCEWLLLNNLEPSFHQFTWRLQNRCYYVSQHLEKNTCAGISFLIASLQLKPLFKKRLRRWCFLEVFKTTFLALNKLWKKSTVIRNADQISTTNLITFILNYTKISVFQVVTSSYIKSYQPEKITKTSE